MSKTRSPLRRRSHFHHNLAPRLSEKAVPAIQYGKTRSPLRRRSHFHHNLAPRYGEKADPAVQIANLVPANCAYYLRSSQIFWVLFGLLALHTCGILH